MTVKELKKILEAYDDNDKIGIEESNNIYEAELYPYETEFTGLLIRLNPYIGLGTINE